MVKKGFTFIELVVAIVVIGIALMSVPLMLSQASKSNEFSINQEAILAGATKIGDILTYPWNETNSSTIQYIFDVKGDSDLNRSKNDNNRRIGNFKAKYRRKFYNQITEANATLGHDKGNEYDDIDDFNGVSEIINGSGTGDYLMDLNLSTKVFYISDDANYSSSPTLNFDLNISSVTHTTNLKMIEVKVYNNTNHELITTLRAFSANIGSYELLYRTFP